MDNFHVTNHCDSKIEFVNIVNCVQIKRVFSINILPK